MPKKMNLTPLYEVMKLTTLWVGVSEKEGKGLKGNSSVWNMRMGTEEDEGK